MLIWDVLYEKHKNRIKMSEIKDYGLLNNHLGKKTKKKRIILQ
jgi:hypothetical protein